MEKNYVFARKKLRLLEEKTTIFGKKVFSLIFFRFYRFFLKF